jgi:hypothetical protein
MNMGLGLKLAMNHLRRVKCEGTREIRSILEQGSIDAAYCLDATEIIPTGHCYFDKFGPGEDDWVAMEGFSVR